MKKFFLPALAVSIAVPMINKAAECRVGVVDLSTAMMLSKDFEKRSKEFEAYKKELESAVKSEIEKAQKQLEKLPKDPKEMTEAQKEEIREIYTKVQQLDETSKNKMEAKKENLLKPLQIRIFKKVETVRKQKKLTVVINIASVVSYDPEYDITNDVLKMEGVSDPQKARDQLKEGNSAPKEAPKNSVKKN